MRERSKERNRQDNCTKTARLKFVFTGRGGGRATMKTQLIMRATGAPLNRIDGVQKVTGAAKYAYEYPVEGVTYVFPVQSTIAKGRVVSIDASAARVLPGVIAVLWHENAPRLAPVDDAELAVFQADVIASYVQFLAA